MCESCPDAAARQYWTGNQCSPACETGFVWDVRKQECEFCAWTLCEPGLQTPVQRDNCTHCVGCPAHPVHAHWSTQNDHFDCMWLCDESYELLDMSCVATNYSAVTTLAQLQPICDPGHTVVNFECKSLHEAAVQGLIAMKNLPQPADIDVKWQWLYGCKWQCTHTAGYWELRPENGLFWECISDKMRLCSCISGAPEINGRTIAKSYGQAIGHSRWPGGNPRTAKELRESVGPRGNARAVPRVNTHHQHQLQGRGCPWHCWGSWRSWRRGVTGSSWHWDRLCPTHPHFRAQTVAPLSRFGAHTVAPLSRGRSS